MNKEYLKKAQPVVYQTLSNALKNQRVANAYLFHGPKGSSKLETAILFAQSIVCEHTDVDGFACQECETCKRIENEESLDYMIVSNDRIKKKDIVDLQAFFESTSAGKQNARIYILDHYDKATPDASNSLLKFLEEPSEGIYGILIADEKSNVLPTIQSRCQAIHFKPESCEHALLENTSEDNAKMLAESGYTYDKAIELLALPDFEELKQIAFDYIEHASSFAQIEKMQTNVFVNKSERMNKDWIQLWIQWVLFYVKNDRVNIPLEKKVKLYSILVENMDMLYRPVDLGLFMDKLYYDIRKAVI